LGNVDYTGNYTGFDNNPHNYLTTSFNTSGFYTGSSQPNGNNFRTFPQLLLRSDPTNNFDYSILKNFSIWDRLVIQPVSTPSMLSTTHSSPPPAPPSPHPHLARSAASKTAAANCRVAFTSFSSLHT